VSQTSAANFDAYRRPRIRVLLAEDHTVVAAGLESLLKEEFDFVGIVQDGRALLEAVDSLQPDVIITDISMPMLNGIEAISQIRARQPKAKVIVLTMHRDSGMAADAFRAGAAGYILKISPVEELIKAVYEVSQGRGYVTSLLAADLIHSLMNTEVSERSTLARLTPRQREVLQLIAEGRTMKEIAGILGISSRTAESHKYETMECLGVKTTAELIKHALKLKLVGE